MTISLRPIRGMRWFFAAMTALALTVSPAQAQLGGGYGGGYGGFGGLGGGYGGSGISGFGAPFQGLDTYGISSGIGLGRGNSYGYGNLGSGRSYGNSGYGMGSSGYGLRNNYSSGYNSAPSSTVPATTAAPYLTKHTYVPGDGYRYPLYYNPATAGYFYYPVAR